MSMISANIPALTAMFNLSRASSRLNNNLMRLSTGFRINRASDNPAGLIASENLRSHMRGLEAASRNIDRAHSVLAVAETGFSEVGSLLRDLDGLVVSAANTGAMSKSERNALQLQANSILQAINRTGITAGFGGNKLLDGSRSFVVSDVSSQVSAASVSGANLAGGESLHVDVAVTHATQQAQVALDFTGSEVDLGGSRGSFTFTVAGESGSVELSVSSGATLDDVASSVNAHTGETGVEASVEDGRVVIRSGNYGSEEFVSVEVINDGGVAGADSGIYTYVDGDPSQIDVATQAAFVDGVTVQDKGVDVKGTINGQAAQGDGAMLTLSSESLSISIMLGTGAAGPGQANAVTTGVLYDALTVTGGPTFQISASVGPGGRVGYGIPEVSTRTLGRSGSSSLADLMAGGRLNLVDGDLAGAQAAVRGAIASVASEQGRIGAFRRNTLGSTQRSLDSTYINIASANSLIRDTDFALETSLLSRNSLLQKSSISVLSQASAQPWSVLNLLA